MVGRTNLVLRHSAPHTSPNFRDIMYWMSELNAAFRQNEVIKISYSPSVWVESQERGGVRGKLVSIFFYIFTSSLWWCKSRYSFKCLENFEVYIYIYIYIYIYECLNTRFPGSICLLKKLLTEWLQLYNTYS